MEQHILYEDNDILVCYKPAGIPVQTARLSEPDMETLLKSYLGKTGKPELYIIHRLDQPVEGIIVFGKNQKSAAILSRQLQHMEMGKTYLAVSAIEKTRLQEAAAAVKENTSFALTDYLKKEAASNSSKVVSKKEPMAKKAQLSYQILHAADTACGFALLLLQIQLLTGRHHQIRVQLSHAKMPLAGDFKYADESCSAFFKQLQIKEVALCASGLCFQHPVTLQKLEYRIKPSSYAFSLVLPEITRQNPS